MRARARGSRLSEVPGLPFRRLRTDPETLRQGHRSDAREQYVCEKVAGHARHAASRSVTAQASVPVREHRHELSERRRAIT